MRNKKTEIVIFCWLATNFFPLFCQGVTDVGGIIEEVASTTRNIALAGSVIIIIIGGFLIMTASGNPDAVERGKRAIFFGIVGVAIIAGASYIADAIFSLMP